MPDGRKHLYALFGQNYLDGDGVESWRATTLNASEVKDYIDQFVVPYLQQESLKARIDELKDLQEYRKDNTAIVYSGDMVGDYISGRIAQLSNKESEESS